MRVHRLSRMLTDLLITLAPVVMTAKPARGAALGVGAGILGIDPIGMVEVTFHFRSLLERALRVPPYTQVLEAGMTPRKSGFLGGRGLSRAFFGGGFRFRLGGEDSTGKSVSYVTALPMAFPDHPDDEASVGAGLSRGFASSPGFSSRVPGGYSIEAGIIACDRFVTTLFELGPFVGK